MSVYIPLASEGFELCHPQSREDFEQINVKINGESRRSSWKPIRMQIIREDDGVALAKSDSPWLGSHALLFRRSVIHELGAMLGKYGELLPIACGGANIQLFNVTRVVDALDEENSSVIRFDDGRIMQISRYEFRSSALGDLEIFKIPNLRVSPTFVNDRFVESWAQAGLQGLEFTRVWSSD